MSDEILFSITKDHLETGLRGYPCGYCTTSYVDPQKGLFYIDKPVSQMSNAIPEEVIYLLYHGREGEKEEVIAFFDQLKKRATLSEKTIHDIHALPRSAHPMKLFSIGLLLLGINEGVGDYREDGLQLIAKLPHLVAEIINYHAGWGKCSQPNMDLGYIESFSAMLNVPSVDKGRLSQVLRLFHVLHMDHGGGNLSTFVGKTVASGLEDMYGSMSSAMCALAGPRHGRANQDCLEFVRNMIQEVGEAATESQVEHAIRHRLANGELVYGFGHAVLRVEDPRATVQYEYLHKHFPSHPLTHMALLLRSAGTKVLKENPKVACPYPNVDAVSGSLLTAAGFGYPEYFTVLFGLSRSVGIAIQVIYERLQARNGKGTPIVRPKYLFKSAN
ncbi:MAG: citrate (Si)-synthase [Chlamydiae bacterium]|nr:citrate (Si)-synthase [Chlamydiota bacterium]